ncbi:MAG: type 2 isopentenyl-diphosphate Delta-isomerase [Anaerolineales bacterium]|jgi:isopentenyl-diphosphate delta-isomerase
MGKVTRTSKRKDDHLRINLERDVESGIQTGLRSIRFGHNALPELALDEIKCETQFLGRALKLPLLISSMTGGTQFAERVNIALAEAAQASQIAMGVGSQRAALEDPSSASSFQVRKHAPDILLFANLGAIQLNYGFGPDECRRAVDMIEADALILHLNALQEALQPEGDTNFKHLLEKIAAVCSALPVPVIAKEVGWGISASVARRLFEAGVSVIDVAGAGGTSWSQVESFRAADDQQAALAQAFRDWGIPTAIAVQQVRNELPETPLIASGGLRTGIDIAKCIALGADICGMAGPFLKAAAESEAAVQKTIDRVRMELRITMFATGSGDLEQLRDGKLILDQG